MPYVSPRMIQTAKNRGFLARKGSIALPGGYSGCQLCRSPVQWTERMMRPSITDLDETAKRIRRDILEMGLRAGGCHLAPALSSADLVTALYFRVMRLSPDQPKDDGRDRFILSAGHKCAVLYVALAHAGYFPREVLDTFSQ